MRTLLLAVAVLATILCYSPAQAQVPPEDYVLLAAFVDEDGSGTFDGDEDPAPAGVVIKCDRGMWYSTHPTDEYGRANVYAPRVVWCSAFSMVDGIWYISALQEVDPEWSGAQVFPLQAYETLFDIFMPRG